MLSVVIPAYNEAARLPATLDAIVAYLRNGGAPFEVVVVDDGSLDGTAEVVRARAATDPGIRLVRSESNHGKGYAVRAGLLEARGDLWLFSDADLATPIEEVEKLRTAIDRGADLVLASRALPESVLPVPQSLRRRVLGRCFNAAVRVSLGIPYRDTQCGFKLMRAGALRGVVERLETHHFGFDFELVYRAHRRGLRIAEVGVVWRDQAGSKVRVWRDGFIMLASLRRIRRLVDATEASV